MKQRLLSLQAAHAGTHDLIHEEEVARDDRARVEDLLLDDVVIKHSQVRGLDGLARAEVQPHRVGAQPALLLQLHDGVLRVVSGVHRQRLGDDEEGLSIRLNAEAALALDGVLVLEQLGVGLDLEGAGAGHHALVLDGVVDGAQPVADRVLDLRERVLVGALDEDGDGLRVLAVLDEGELLLAEDVFVDESGVPEGVLGDVVDGVERGAAASQRQALHVAALGAAQRHDALLGQRVQRQRVDALLVDQHERLVRAVAHLLLQSDDLKYTSAMIVRLGKYGNFIQERKNLRRFQDIDKLIILILFLNL